MEPRNFPSVENFRALSRHIRFGFMLTLIVAGILVGYFLIWLTGFNQARYERSWNGLRQVCDLLYDQLPKSQPIDLNGGETPLLPFQYVHGKGPDQPACLVRHLVAWTARPCDQEPHQIFEVESPSGKVQVMTCPDFKNHTGLLIDEFRTSIGAHFTHDDISIPAFASRLSVIDFILLAPIFLLFVILWTQANLQHARSFLIRWFAGDHAALDSLGVILAEIPLFRPNSGGALAPLMWGSSVLPAGVMVLLLGSDIYDLFLSHAVFTPRSEQPIWEWTSGFDSGMYGTTILVREAILLIATLLLLVGGIRNTVVLLGIRAISCFGVLRPALEKQIEERVAQLIQQRGGAPVMAVHARIYLLPATMRRLGFYRMKNWLIQYHVSVDDGHRIGQLDFQTTVPALHDVHWEFSMPMADLVEQVKNRLSGYFTLVENEVSASLFNAPP